MDDLKKKKKKKQGLQRVQWREPLDEVALFNESSDKAGVIHRFEVNDSFKDLGIISPLEILKRQVRMMMMMMMMMMITFDYDDIRPTIMMTMTEVCGRGKRVPTSGKGEIN